MKLKKFNQFITEVRDPKMERLSKLGLTSGDFFTWEVNYDDDMSPYEKADKQSMYDYESPSGAHVTKAEGVIDQFETKLTIDLSDGDQIQLHIKFPQPPGDNARAMFNVRTGGGTYVAPKWHLVFGHNPKDSKGIVEEWLDLIEQHNSEIWPIFYYYEKFLNTPNESLDTTTNEMIKSDSTKLKLFIRALRDLPIDSSEILKIRELVNTRSIDPYNDRLSILAEVDRVFSDIPGLSKLVQKFSRPLS